MVDQEMMKYMNDKTCEFFKNAFGGVSACVLPVEEFKKYDCRSIIEIETTDGRGVLNIAIMQRVR